jgi:hypothetical protein
MQSGYADSNVKAIPDTIFFLTEVDVCGSFGMQMGLFEGACPFNLNPQRRRVRREEKIREGAMLRERIFIPIRFSAREEKDSDFFFTRKSANQMK